MDTFKNPRNPKKKKKKSQTPTKVGEGSEEARKSGEGLNEEALDTIEAFKTTWKPTDYGFGTGNTPAGETYPENQGKERFQLKVPDDPRSKRTCGVGREGRVGQKPGCKLLTR